MSDNELPPNWRTAKAADGKEYYFNELTGETSWTLPAVAQPAVNVAPLVSEPAAPVASKLEAGAITPQAVSAPVSGASLVVAPGATPNAEPRSSTRPFANVRGSLAALGDSLPKLLVISVCSFVVMLQASIEYSQAGPDGTFQIAVPGSGLAKVPLALGPTAYAIAVGTVSLAFTIGLLLFATLRPNVFQAVSVPLPRDKGTLNMSQIFSLFLLTWWSVGTGVLTFHAPYTETSNAYFSCWGALFCSVLLCAYSYTQVNSAWKALSEATDDMIGTKQEADSTMQVTAILMVCSATLFLASVDHLGSGYGGYAFACGLLSMIVITLAGFLKKTNRMGPPGQKGFAVLLLLLWIFAAGVLTFDRPFKSTGNGFFASWVGLISASSLTYKELFGEQIVWSDGLKRSFSLSHDSTELNAVASRM
mmetsp:Transcript_16881/g.28054  ORF Transcript_16881/g.28054 Transcript_16881/m.28054 type:complete len:420 (+) Transcript_16881:35-1294(+)|eukprot:CAMPEP_0119314146 /NCGR_PEP_ID=MMETSP1333-20130426/31830_1 /TAXON_ID=418940 /ORGANISM="Scyphosphaera apsteinii, Strain RCC1455" /LENGTH=419 /DNA_ID=CAMNT_0007319201 /DNA_START=36 /DNA_END=1295 /DNA_ORIENTATION=-